MGQGRRATARGIGSGSSVLLQALPDDVLEPLQPGLAAGLYMLRGKLVNEKVGETLGIPVMPWQRVLEEVKGS